MTSKSQIWRTLHSDNWSNGGLQRRLSSTKPFLLDLAQPSPSLMTSRPFASVRFNSPWPLACNSIHQCRVYEKRWKKERNISIYKNKCRHNLMHIPKSNHEGLWYLEVIKIESNELHKMADDSLDRLGIKRVWPASRPKLTCRLQRGVWGSISNSVFYLFLQGLENSLKARKSTISQKVNNSKVEHITSTVLEERNVSVEDSLMFKYIFHEARTQLKEPKWLPGTWGEPRSYPGALSSDARYSRPALTHRYRFGRRPRLSARNARKRAPHTLPRTNYRSAAQTEEECGKEGGERKKRGRGDRVERGGTRSRWQPNGMQRVDLWPSPVTANQ